MRDGTSWHIQTQKQEISMLLILLKALSSLRSWLPKRGPCASDVSYEVLLSLKAVSQRACFSKCPWFWRSVFMQRSISLQRKLKRCCQLQQRGCFGKLLVWSRLCFYYIYFYTVISRPMRKDISFWIGTKHFIPDILYTRTRNSTRGCVFSRKCVVTSGPDGHANI